MRKLLIVLLLVLLGVGFWQSCQDSDWNRDQEQECPEGPECPDYPELFPLPDAPTGRQAFKDQESTLLRRINEVRAEHGVRWLTFDWRLYLAASLQVQILAARCAERDSCDAAYKQCWEDHQCPGQPSFAERLRWAGWSGPAGEIAQGGSDYLSMDELVQGWLESPSHRAIILNGNWTHGACGFWRLHHGYIHVYAVCILGRSPAA